MQPNHPADYIKSKIPDDWGEGVPTRKGDGIRFRDPIHNGNSVRVDRGNSQSSLTAQQIDHIVVNSGGKVLGRDGNPIDGAIKSDPVNAHIPLSEYRGWRTWNKP